MHKITAMSTRPKRAAPKAKKEQSPPADSKKSKRGFSFDDLKRFSQSAVTARKLLSDIKAKEPPKSDVNNDFNLNPEEERDLEEGKALAEESIARYTSGMTAIYAGEKILFMDYQPKFRTKSIDEFLNGDVDQESLFNALAFATSTTELNIVKGILRQYVADRKYSWKPSLDQFSAILKTVYGADLNSFIPDDYTGDFMANASSYAENHFITNTPEPDLDSSDGDDSEDEDEDEDIDSEDSLAIPKLESLLNILALFGWDSKTSPLDESNFFIWLRILITLSLDVECRNRAYVQYLIQECIHRLFDAIKDEAIWNEFDENIYAAIPKAWIGHEHLPKMVHFCSVLPANTVKCVQLRSSMAFAYLSMILSTDQTEDKDPPNVIGQLIELCEGLNEKKHILHDLFALRNLLELLQYALTRSVIVKLPPNQLDRLMNDLRWLVGQRRGHGSVIQIRMSATDAALMRLLVDGIVEKVDMYGKRKKSLFRFSNYRSASSSSLLPNRGAISQFGETTSVPGQPSTSAPPPDETVLVSSDDTEGEGEGE